MASSKQTPPPCPARRPKVIDKIPIPTSENSDIHHPQSHRNTRSSSKAETRATQFFWLLLRAPCGILPVNGSCAASGWNPHGEGWLRVPPTREPTLRGFQHLWHVQKRTLLFANEPSECQKMRGNGPFCAPLGLARSMRSAHATFERNKFDGQRGFGFCTVTGFYLNLQGAKSMLHSIIIRDLRYSARRLWARPTHAAAVILTLALAIGANTAVFSALHGLLFKPLPFANSEQLVQIFNSYPKTRALATPLASTAADTKARRWPSAATNTPSLTQQ